MGFLSRNIHAAVVHKEMRPVVIIYPIDRVIGKNILLAGQESTNVSSESLAISCQFRVRSISRNIVDQILGDVGSRSVGQSGGMGKTVMRIDESFISPRIRGHILFHFGKIPDRYVVTSDLRSACHPGADHFRWHALVQTCDWLILVMVPIGTPFVSTDAIQIGSLHYCTKFSMFPL